MKTAGDKEDPEKTAADNLHYARTILNSISAHVAIIDENGVILETNRAWQRFAASNQLKMRPDTLYVNYLAICDNACSNSDERSCTAAEGIRKVIKGSEEEFVMVYPCHSPSKKRWFNMRAVRALSSGPLRVVISHEDITALKLAEESLRQREAELREKTDYLEEANAALRALLRQRDEDKKEMEKTFFQNLRESVLPYIERLRRISRGNESLEMIGLIESGLNNISSPLLRRLSTLESVLTPQEMQVARLIKEGKSTKDIAGLLNLSVTTINFHRRNLRDKLGLTNTPANLRSFLLSLDE